MHVLSCLQEGWAVQEHHPQRLDLVKQKRSKSCGNSVEYWPLVSGGEKNCMKNSQLQQQTSSSVSPTTQTFPPLFWLSCSLTKRFVFLILQQFWLHFHLFWSHFCLTFLPPRKETFYLLIILEADSLKCLDHLISNITFWFWSLWDLYQILFSGFGWELLMSLPQL